MKSLVQTFSALRRVARFWFVLIAILAACLMFIGPSYSQSQSKPAETSTKSPAGSDQDFETIVTDSTLTTIMMTASDKKGRLITTLKSEDISVVEDGVPQRIEVFERETERPLSLAFVFDVSSSQIPTLGYQKKAASLFLKNIIRPGQDRVAVISFASETTLEQTLTGDPAVVEQAIDRLQPSGGTAMYDAVFLTCLKVFRNTPGTNRRAIILLTDGGDTMSKLRPDQAVNGAVYTNTIVYGIGIGIGPGMNEQSLSHLTNLTGGRTFLPFSEKELNVVFQQIEQELRAQYVIAYRPTNKAQDGKQRNIKIRITNPAIAREKLKLAYRDHYFVKNRRPAN